MRAWCIASWSTCSIARSVLQTMAHRFGFPFTNLQPLHAKQSTCYHTQLRIWNDSSTVSGGPHVPSQYNSSVSRFFSSVWRSEKPPTLPKLEWQTTLFRSGTQVFDKCTKALIKVDSLCDYWGYRAKPRQFILSDKLLSVLCWIHKWYTCLHISDSTNRRIWWCSIVKPTGPWSLVYGQRGNRPHEIYLEFSFHPLVLYVLGKRPIMWSNWRYAQAVILVQYT